MADFWRLLEESGSERLLVVAPHPDDEIFAVGGIMALAAKRGIDVGVLAVTDGEASHARSSRVTRSDLVSIRQDEVLAAYNDLGISPERTRLALPDSGVTADAVRDGLRPHLTPSTAVLSPLWDDGHPDHDATGRAVVNFDTDELATRLYYPVWSRKAFSEKSRLQPSRYYEVHLEPSLLQAKQRAIQQFQSQFFALGPLPEDGPVLPPGFELPFLSGTEVLYDPA